VTAETSRTTGSDRTRRWTASGAAGPFGEALVTATSADVRPSAAAGSRSAGLSFIFLAGAVILLGATLATANRPTVAVVWGGVAVGAYAAGLVCLACAAQHSGLSLARWKVGLWLLIWYGIVFGIATVTWSQPQTGVSSEIALSSVIRALWLVAVAMTAWVIGYLIGPGQVVRASMTAAMGKLGERFTTQVRSPAAPWIVYAIGLAARLASTALTGRFGYVGDAAAAVSAASSYAGVLGALTLFGPLAVAAAALQVFRERLPAARITLAILFLVELAFGAAAGGKLSFVITVLAVVIPYATVRRRVPGIALIALIAIFFLVVIPFNQAYRASARQGSVPLSPRQAVATAPRILGQTLTGHSVAEILPSSLGYLAQRIREIDSVAIIVQRTPKQVAFLSPVQLIEGPVTGIIPRVLWPGKPLLITGYQFSQEYFYLPSNLYTSTADTMIGGLYWHGGWIPTIVGMFLLGCAFRLLDDVLDVRRNPHAIFLVLLLLPSLVGGEEDWQSILTSLPATMFVWLFAVALTFRAGRRA
jgi:hypothetical protein